MARKRTRHDLLALFDEQVEFLRWSNAAFDDGRLSESKRLATTIRVLLHDTKNSHALVNQLGLEKALTWVDTAGRPNPTNVLPTFGLIQQGIKIEEGKGTPQYRAPLDNYRPGHIQTTATTRIPRGSRVYFDMWWTYPVVKDAAGVLYTRKQLVLALVNKEGGAHIDPDVQESYDKIANFNSMGWTYSEGPEGRSLTSTLIAVGSPAAAPLNVVPQPQKGWSEPLPMMNPVPYMVRQISYEVVESVDQQRDRIK